MISTLIDSTTSQVITPFETSFVSADGQRPLSRVTCVLDIKFAVTTDLITYGRNLDGIAIFMFCRVPLRK